MATEFPDREVSDGGHKGIVLCDYKLPENKFQVDTARILILLPTGYPDSPPDIFNFQCCEIAAATYSRKNLAGILNQARLSHER